MPLLKYSAKKYLPLRRHLALGAIALALSSILVLGSLAYWKFTEFRNFQNAIKSGVAELAGQLSLPLKVRDKVRAHRILARSPLSKSSFRMNILDRTNHAWHSIGASGITTPCKGLKYDSLIEFSGSTIGSLSICHKPYSASKYIAPAVVISVLLAIIILLAMTTLIRWQRKDVDDFVGLVNRVAPNGVIDESVLPEKPPSGLASAYRKLSWLLGEIKRNQNIQLETQVELAVAKSARQVAHDIRSPLAAMLAISAKSNYLPEQERLLLQAATRRIRDIANELSKKNLENVRAKDTPDINLRIEPILPMIEDLVGEKRIEIQSKSNVRIDFEAFSEHYGLFSRLNPIDFKRVLSNLINNSIEAFDNDPGKISIKCNTSHHDTITLTVTDNGMGVPPHLLAQVFELGKSFGKETEGHSGSGLGLAHAKEAIEKVGGRIEMKSMVGHGTTVLISLPRAEHPTWFVTNLKVFPNMKIAVIDDDLSIHRIWQSRIEPDILDHFKTPEELISAHQSQAPYCLYLVDYEIVNSDLNGLDLIASLKIESKSILVTSRSEEAEIRMRCHQMGVKLLPKSMAHLIPIQLQNLAQMGDSATITKAPIPLPPFKQLTV